MKNPNEAIKDQEPVPSLSLAYILFVLFVGFLSNICAGLVSTLMSAYLPNSILDLLGTLATEEASYVGSYINALYILGWALGGMTFGWLGDRVGRVNTLASALLFTAIFTLLVAWTPNWYLLVGLRFFSGFGVGAIMVLSAVLIAEVWGDRVRGRAIALGVLAVGFPVGIISSGLVTYFITDWRTAFFTGFLPLIVAIICYLFFKEPKQWSAGKTENGDSKFADFSSFKQLIDPKNRKNFFVAGTIFGTMLVGIWATFSWLPTWAQNLSVNNEEALQAGGTLVVLLGSGGILGSVISGFLANSLGRKGALMLAFGGAFFASIILYLTNQEFSSIIYLETAFLALFFGISQAILSAYIPELFSVEIRSTATGVCFNIGRFATAAAVFFVGILVPILGGYGNSLLVFSFAYFVGFITVLFGEETKGKVL